MEELVRRTLLVATEAESILTQMENESVSIDTVLLEENLVCEKDLLSALSATYGFATAGAKESVESVDDAVFRMFPEQLAVKYGGTAGFENGIYSKYSHGPTQPEDSIRLVNFELKLKPV